MRNSHLEGYVYLTPNEEREAREWFRSHGEKIPDMDEGILIAGSPIIYGLTEDPNTGRLVIPKGEAEECNLRAEAMKSLTPRQLQVIELRLMGKTQREIAAKLGISQKNVNKLLSKAKKRLRETKSMLRER